MAATGRRTAVQLDALVKGAGGRFKAFRQLPFMIPLTSGCTYSGPSQEIYRQVKLLAQAPGVTGISFACGFCPADFAGAGASLVAYATSQQAADAAADQLLEAALERESRSEEHTSELQSLMRISYAVFCLKKNKNS